jgi:peptidoglycan/LPS O-acetylase OafA/YrhL
MNRIFGLDLMRFTAISFVLIGHGWFLFGDLGVFATNIKNILVFGVEIFFVLSGFLIGGILLRDFEKSLKLHDVLHFWKRRWFRTLPNYLLFLVINYIGFSFLSADFSWNWQYLFFLQNFAWMQDGFFSVSWSLAIEEWFYLIIPLAIIFPYRFMSLKRAVLLVIFTMIICITALRLYGSIYNGYSWNEELRLVTIFRLDALMYGVFAAWLNYYYKDFFIQSRNKGILIGLVCLTILIYLRNSDLVITSPIASALFFPFSSFSFMCFLPILSTWQLRSHNYAVRLVTSISVWAYSLYLVHIPTLEIVKILAHKFPAIYQYPLNVIVFITWLTISTLASFIIFTLFEKPMTNLRNKTWFTQATDKLTVSTIKDK